MSYFWQILFLRICIVHSLKHACRQGSVGLFYRGPYPGVWYIFSEVSNLLFIVAYVPPVPQGRAWLRLSVLGPGLGMDQDWIVVLYALHRRKFRGGCVRYPEE